MMYAMLVVKTNNLFKAARKEIFLMARIGQLNCDKADNLLNNIKRKEGNR